MNLVQWIVSGIFTVIVSYMIWLYFPVPILKTLNFLGNKNIIVLVYPEFMGDTSDDYISGDSSRIVRAFKDPKNYKNRYYFTYLRTNKDGNKWCYIYPQVQVGKLYLTNDGGLYRPRNDITYIKKWYPYKGDWKGYTYNGETK